MDGEMAVMTAMFLEYPEYCVNICVLHDRDKVWGLMKE